MILNSVGRFPRVILNSLSYRISLSPVGYSETQGPVRAAVHVFFIKENGHLAPLKSQKKSKGLAGLARLAAPGAPAARTPTRAYGG